MVSNIIGCTYDVLGDLCLRACSRQDVNKFIRVVCAINLQRITNVLRCFWGFSIVLNFATHQSTLYLDLCFCVFIEEHNTIVNLHGCALPMFDRHTGKVMFDMVSKFLTVLYLDWTICLIGLASDGTRNMTGRVAGVVTRLDAWRLPFNSDLVWSASTGPCHGTHYEQCCQRTLLHYHDRFHHSYNPPIEVNHGYEHNVPSHCQPMAIDRKGY